MANRSLMRTMVDSGLCIFRVQKEFSPSAAEIKRSHAVYQEWIVVAVGCSNERPPGVTQPFTNSDAVCLHIPLKYMKPTGGLRRPPDYCRFRKREQKRPAVSGKRGRPAAPSNRTSLTRHLRRVRCEQLPDRHPAVYKRSRMSMARKNHMP